jgi:hypothetical protein
VTGSTERVALATCRQLPMLSEDDRELIEGFAAMDINAAPAVWDDPSVAWSDFNLTIVRSCWDYHERRPEFVRWAHGVVAVANPADILEWNTDKRHLADLAATDVPIVPTAWVTPGDAWQVPWAGTWVAKPSVSLSGLNAGRYDASDAEQRSLLAAHVDGLLAAGGTVMIQPYQSAIDTDGETALIFIGGRFDHAIRKGAVLSGPASDADHRFEEDGGMHLAPCDATAAQLEIAGRALDRVPGGSQRLLYARVDLVPGADGRPLLMELELTEPQLFFKYAPGSADAMAVAAAAQIRGTHQLGPPQT